MVKQTFEVRGEVSCKTARWAGRAEQHADDTGERGVRNMLPLGLNPMLKTNATGQFMVWRMAASLLALALLMCSHVCAVEDPPKRIVSTAPNLTEILFALGLGERVVGVSDFCDYPEEARSKPRIGGFVDTSIEAIVALRPDLVILLKSNGESIRQLKSLGVPTLEVRDESLADIRDAIESIGKRCAAVEAARSLIEHLDVLTGARKDGSGAGSPFPRVLVCFGRIEQGGKPVSFYAGASGSLYDELTKLAGGQTAIAQTLPLYPLVSIEGLYTIDPDVVIELTGAGDPGTRGSLTGDLSPLTSLRAVKGGHWHLVEGEWAVRPGPRIFQLVEPIAAAVAKWHKEAR